LLPLVELSRCGGFLLVLAWKGRDSFAEHCNEVVNHVCHATQQAEDTVSVWSTGLRVLASIGHMCPDAVTLLVGPCLDQVANVLLTVDDDSKPFYQFIAFACAALPEQMAGNELVMAALVNDRTDADFFPAAVALFHCVDDDLRLAIVASGTMTLVGEDPWPVCFDADSAAAQFRELCELFTAEQQQSDCWPTALLSGVTGNRRLSPSGW
jgi:hypothetical protein